MEGEEGEEEEDEDDEEEEDEEEEGEAEAEEEEEESGHGTADGAKLDALNNLLDARRQTRGHGLLPSVGQTVRGWMSPRATRASPSSSGQG